MKDLHISIFLFLNVPIERYLCSYLLLHFRILLKVPEKSKQRKSITRSKKRHISSNRDDALGNLKPRDKFRIKTFTPAIDTLESDHRAQTKSFLTKLEATEKEIREKKHEDPTSKLEPVMNKKINCSLLPFLRKKPVDYQDSEDCIGCTPLTIHGRATHYVLRVPNRKEALQFFKDVLGMRVLRHEEFSSGCGPACKGLCGTLWSKTMVGYGPEDKFFAFELAYSYSNEKYTSGNGFCSATIRGCEYFKQASKSRWPVIEGNALVAPGGYKFIIQDDNLPRNADPIQKITLTSSNMKRTVKYWNGTLGFNICSLDHKRRTCGFCFKDCSTIIEFQESTVEIEHGDSFGRLAFICPVTQLSKIERTIVCSKYNIINPLMTVRSNGRDIYRVIVLADPDEHEVCFYDDVSFKKLSKFNPEASAILQRYVELESEHIDKIRDLRKKSSKPSGYKEDTKEVKDAGEAGTKSDVKASPHYDDSIASKGPSTIKPPEKIDPSLVGLTSLKDDEPSTAAVEKPSAPEGPSFTSIEAPADPPNSLLSNKSLQDEQQPFKPTATEEQAEVTKPTAEGEPSESAKPTVAEEDSEPSKQTPEGETPILAEPPVIEEPSILKEPSVTEEPSAIKDPSVGEEPAVAEEPAVVEEPAVLEEPTVLEEPAVVEEPPVIKEEPVVKDPSVIEEPSTVEELTVVKDPSVVIEPSVMKEPSGIEKSSIMEEPAVVKEPSDVKEPSVTKDPSVVNDLNTEVPEEKPLTPLISTEQFPIDEHESAKPSKEAILADSQLQRKSSAVIKVDGTKSSQLLPIVSKSQSPSQWEMTEPKEVDETGTKEPSKPPSETERKHTGFTLPEEPGPHVFWTVAKDANRKTGVEIPQEVERSQSKIEARTKGRDAKPEDAKPKGTKPEEQKPEERFETKNPSKLKVQQSNKSRSLNVKKVLGSSQPVASEPAESSPRNHSVVEDQTNIGKANDSVILPDKKKKKKKAG